MRELSDHRSIKIIAADDNRELLRVVKQILEFEGFQVRISVNAKDINLLIRQEQPDIIMLDIRMEGVDGCDVCRALKSNAATSSIPVILISANEDTFDRANDCKADGYLTKPFDMNELLSMIADLTSRAQPA